MIPGTSYSGISGDKTENNLGYEQSWIIKTDSLGNKQWDKTIFTATVSDNEIGLAVQTKDGCYAISNYTNGGIGGYVSEPGLDSSFIHFDYWIVKFCDTTLSVNSINSLQNQFDVSPNPFTSNITITIQKQELKQATILITDILGEAVFNSQEKYLNHNLTETIDLSYLSSGIYLVEVNIDGERLVKKILKE